MCRYSWPGNVRELQNVLRRIILVNEDEEALDSMLTFNNHPKQNTNTLFRGGPAPNWLNFLKLNGDESQLKSLSLKEIGKTTSDLIEKQVIGYVLDKTGWNRSKANKILGISYKTLLAKIQNLELTPDRHLEENSSAAADMN
jgi:DNA-binding NtrC family response regulator